MASASDPVSGMHKPRLKELMSEKINLQAYLASLPEVETARLRYGTLFTANGRIYQVVEVRAGGFHKAREWRGDEKTEVALVPGSFLANFLPVVARGRLLPVYPTRMDLTEDGEPIYYLFPGEQQALDAAYLDVALVQSKDAYIRNHGREPAFAATDGNHILRLYYYSRSVRGYSFQIEEDFHKQTIQFRLCRFGPMYWRLLPSWQEPLPGTADETLPRKQEHEYDE